MNKSKRYIVQIRLWRYRPIRRVIGTLDDIRKNNPSGWFQTISRDCACTGWAAMSMPNRLQRDDRPRVVMFEFPGHFIRVGG
jgi:hypothetical protein